MIVLYIEENKNYTETFVSSEKDILKKHGDIIIEEIILSNMKITVKGLLLSLFNYKTYILIPQILIVLLNSFSNYNRLISNIHCSILFLSNLNLIRNLNVEECAHIRAHFLAKRATFALLLSKLTGVNYSLVAHAADIFDWDNSISYKIKHSLNVDCISNYNIGYLNAKCKFKYSNKLRLIRNSFPKPLGIYEDKELSFSNKRKIHLLFVGRLIKKKGIMEFLQILLKFEHFNFTFDLVGDGPLALEIETFLKENSLDEKVVLKGVLKSEKVHELMSKSDFLVLSSLNADYKFFDMDGIPTVFFESLSIGLPVITTCVSGIPELIIDSFNGVYIDNKSERVAKLLENNILYFNSSKKAIISHFNRFSSGSNGAELLLNDLKIL